MTTSIQGTDLILQAPREGFDPRLILEVVGDSWPRAMFQDADADGPRPLQEAIADDAVGRSSEFFLYADEASARSWNQDGWTAEHGNAMLHFLIREKPADPESLEITLVVDQLKGEPAVLAAELAAEFERLEAKKNANRMTRRRINFQDELRAVGYDLPRDEFYDLVDGLRRVLYPEWTQDELVCHPREAVQFCDAVRGKAKAPVPDHLILKALMNRRKHRLG
jgi:hypothetical protein